MVGMRGRQSSHRTCVTATSILIHLGGPGLCSHSGEVGGEHLTKPVPGLVRQWGRGAGWGLAVGCIQFSVVLDPGLNGAWRPSLLGGPGDEQKAFQVGLCISRSPESLNMCVCLGVGGRSLSKSGLRMSSLPQTPGLPGHWQEYRRDPASLGKRTTTSQ